MPFDAPAVYSNNEVARYEKMAELVIGSISSRFTEMFYLGFVVLQQMDHTRQLVFVNVF